MIAIIGYANVIKQQSTFLKPGRSSQSLPNTNNATKTIITHQYHAIKNYLLVFWYAHYTTQKTYFQLYFTVDFTQKTIELYQTHLKSEKIDADLHPLFVYK